MTSEARGATVTILFTDLVSSTELLQRAGDEDAQRIFKAHHKLLRDAVAAHGGHEVKWLGDGLMVAFPSAADAVRCAVAMQQSARRLAGERLAIRVGLNAGDALRDESDYFGTAVVIAKRLCDRADAGQVLCSSLVAGLLSGRQAFQFQELGQLELKGIAAPVSACEVVYDRDEPGAFLTYTPFVGRETETARLRQRLEGARAGRGGLVMLVGEPGIGKTRTAEEFAEYARSEGTVVLWGRCYEGEWAPPYGPFAEAIAEYVRDADPEVLRQDMGYGVAPIARLVPSLRDALPDLPDPEPLQPDEERFRMLDAVSQFLIAASQRAPIALVLDDLHWADKGTIAMLRHVARFAQKSRTLILGAYRDVELDRQHPLSDALGQLRRETEYERLLLKGLDSTEVGELLAAVADQEAPEALVDAISRETDGNPFFIREVLLHLVETGALYRKDGRWTSDVAGVEELGIPEGVRQVVGQRLSRLSEDANSLLTAASAFAGAFRFDIAARVADLDERAALDAVDQALAAQVLRPGASADTCDFTHALFRHTLYTELSPPRQVRLHRQIAEALEQTQSSSEHAAEIAYHYHRSATLPGAERGVDYAIVAGEGAEAAAAWDEAATFFRMALDLMSEDDPRRPRTLGRLSIALVWALHFEEAVEIATRAADALVEREDANAAADFLADVAWALGGAGYVDGAWVLAEKGVPLKGDRRDAAWARIRGFDLQRLDAADPSYVGIEVMTPERRELDNVAREMGVARTMGVMFAFRPSGVASRDDAEEQAREFHAQPRTWVGSGDPWYFEAVIAVFLLGDARRGSELWAVVADDYERSGRIALAALCCAGAARSRTALGLFEEGELWRGRGLALAARVGAVSPADINLAAARYDRAVMTGEGWERLFAEVEETTLQPRAQDIWAFAATRACVARGLAWLGQAGPAIAQIAELVAPLDLAMGAAPNYPLMACGAAETLWLLDRRDHIDTVERNLREKVVQPDFRYINVDGRLSLARLCALRAHYDEAARWFAEARVVLEEDGARPLRAIVDYDEALMYIRRGEAGDQERARPLLNAALAQFSEIGMAGWVRRAEELLP